MRLLVFTPTYGGGMDRRCRDSVFFQDYAGEWDWVADDDDPFPPPDHRNVLAKYQRAQKQALAGDYYDALVTVEHDMVLPLDALTKLVAANKPVIYGVYMLRHGSTVLNAWRREGTKALGQSLSLFPDELGRAKRAGLWPVSGCGWGCTFIRRDVLAAVPFHDGGEQNLAGDLVFAVDCLRQGFEAYAHFGVQCGHVHDGVVLWPFDTATGETMRYIAMATINTVVDGKPVHLDAGQEFEALKTPIDLLRAGYARPAVEYAPVEAATDTAAERRETATTGKAKRQAK